MVNSQILEINASLTNMKIENDLRRQVLADIARLRDTGTYRGKRHAMALPVRGQKTKGQVNYNCRVEAGEEPLSGDLSGFRRERKGDTHRERETC